MEAKRENKSTNLNIRIESGLLMRVRKCAKLMYDTPLSKFVRAALVKYCDDVEQRKNKG